MIIYPAIDLKAGQCVRLYQGSFENMTTYDLDPVEIACAYKKAGAEFLHVVDLDGAKSGTPIHAEIIAKIIKASQLKLQVGGGVRGKAAAEMLFDQGVSRIIVGSAAIKNPNEIKSWFQTFGNEAVVLALDIKFDQEDLPKVAMHGWLEQSEMNLWQVLELYQDVQLKHVLCTDIDCDGTLQGPNLQLYQTCVEKYPELQFQASGGIGSLEDIRQLAKIKVAGAIIGKALYEEKFNLSQALKELAAC